MTKVKARKKLSGPDRGRFVAEYLVDLSATQAALRCGYSPKTAHSQGSRLLNSVDISAKVTEAMAKREAETGITAKRVLDEVDVLALGDIGDVLDFSGEHVSLRPANQISERGRRLLASMKVKRTFEKGADGLEPVETIEFKMWDKNAALRLSMQHRGMLTEKVEHTGKDGAPLEINAVQVYIPENGRNRTPL